MARTLTLLVQARSERLIASETDMENMRNQLRAATRDAPGYLRQRVSQADTLRYVHGRCRAGLCPPVLAWLLSTDRAIGDAPCPAAKPSSTHGRCRRMCATRLASCRRWRAW